MHVGVLFGLLAIQTASGDAATTSPTTNSTHTPPSMPTHLPPSLPPSLLHTQPNNHKHYKQVRSTATSTLQTAVVSAEVLGVLPGSLERGLREWMLPPLEALSKKMGGKGKRELPQVRVVC